MLGQRMGLAVEELGERSVRVHGEVRGRPLHVEIDGKSARSEFARFLFGVNTISSRNRMETWSTKIAVRCANPRRALGVIESSVDANDPTWQPRNFDPRHCRRVRTDPVGLAEQALSADVHERLMSIIGDVRIQVGPEWVVIDHQDTAVPGKGANYVAGSLIHRYQGSPLPWPDRAIAGPPWWIELLCDIADTVDR